MHVNDELRWVQQALVDYANNLPLAAREACAERADRALRAIQQAVNQPPQPAAPSP